MRSFLFRRDLALGRDLSRHHGDIYASPTRYFLFRRDLALRRNLSRHHGDIYYLLYVSYGMYLDDIYSTLFPPSWRHLSRSMHISYIRDLSFSLRTSRSFFFPHMETSLDRQGSSQHHNNNNNNVLLGVPPHVVIFREKIYQRERGGGWGVLYIYCCVFRLHGKELLCYYVHIDREDWGIDRKGQLF